MSFGLQRSAAREKVKRKEEKRKKEKKKKRGIEEAIVGLRREAKMQRNECFEFI